MANPPKSTTVGSKKNDNPFFLNKNITRAINKRVEIIQV
jgi:hypothetical protein